MKRIIGLLAIAVVLTATTAAFACKNKCPKLYHQGVIEMDINPAFLTIDEFGVDGEKTDGLVVSSFFNNDFELNPWVGKYLPLMPPFAPDQVGLIRDIGDLTPEAFDFSTDYEKLTELVLYGPPKTTWPNEARRVPDGILPFEGVIIPQGFHVPPFPGRLVIVDVDTKIEYIVAESTLDLTASQADVHTEGNSPRFYHEALFYDMDGDGLKDIVTVRGGFKMNTTVNPMVVYPPFSELVWFRNPGVNLSPFTAWEEHLLVGSFPVGFMGPDIHLSMYDFEDDGVPEIVATHFFSGDDDANAQTPPANPTKGKIVIYGAPIDGDWTDVNIFVPTPFTQPRMTKLTDSHGFPFAIEIADLNADGQVELLATNHQLNCTPYPTGPGQVYVMEQPASGDIFNDEWPVRILMDEIRPQPTPTQANGMRMAPGHAMTFFPKEKQEDRGKRPWILVSGDEAGKVWMMKPKGPDFDYNVSVIFDINDYYGAETTQTFTPEGVTISTIGKPALRYAEKWGHGHHNHGKRKGVTEIYIPVFEAQDIHVFSFQKKYGQTRIQCPADVTLSCVQ